MVRSLQQFPDLNSMIDGNEQILFDYCDISVAVSGPKGLMVPVVRNAESMSFSDIESEIKRLAVRARDGKITVDEMTGGTFTISNGGVLARCYPRRLSIHRNLVFWECIIFYSVLWL